MKVNYLLSIILAIIKGSDLLKHWTQELENDSPPGCIFSQSRSELQITQNTGEQLTPWMVVYPISGSDLPKYWRALTN